MPPETDGCRILKGYEIQAEIPNPLQTATLIGLCVALESLRTFSNTVNPQSQSDGRTPRSGAQGSPAGTWPNPPPPGVSMRSRWPGRSVPVDVPGGGRP